METLHVLRDNDGVAALLDYLEGHDVVAFDTETTGLSQDAEIIGYSICAEPDIAYYVVTAYWSVEHQKLIYLETKDSAPLVMESLTRKRLIMHNGLFDCAQVENNYQVNLTAALFCDTMILAHLLDENRRVGLKELGVARYGDQAKAEQDEMKASVESNGGLMTKKCYELYKGSSDLIGKYGAKDTILTYNLFYELMPQLIEEGLDGFFFDDESMKLLRGPTYELNTVGLKIDLKRLEDLKKELEIDIQEARAFVYHEIDGYVKEQYPGTNKCNVFNVNSGQQLAWLLFDVLKEPFPKLGDAGRELTRTLKMRDPKTKADRAAFIQTLKELKGGVWREAGKVWDKKTRKYKAEAKVKDYWTYLSTDKVVLKAFSKKYQWVERLLKWKSDEKLLGTYVGGIQAGLRYGIIHPSFKQHGTTSGRYSSSQPNFQNLPREDKRIKECIIARPGKVFVGADYSQLEPRVFASVSGDQTLQDCFRSGEDFYSVVGAPIFGKTDCSLFKDASDSFAKKYPKLRDQAKVIALATPYGRTAHQQASALGITVNEAAALIKTYFSAYPKVELMMLESHELAKRDGYTTSLFGRPRRIPDAKKINEIFGNLPHAELPYEARSLLNLAQNHRVQSTAASIMNRSSIAFYDEVRAAGLKNCHIVMQVHDELVVECMEADAEKVVSILKHAMEDTVSLPGVALQADPKVGRKLSDLK